MRLAVIRNGFDIGLAWADELARFASLSLVYLAMPRLALRGQHIAIGMLPELLGGRIQTVMAIGVELGVLAFCTLTLYGTHAYLMRAGKFSTQAMSLSNWVFYAPATLGITLFALVAVLRLLKIAGFGQSPDHQTGSHP
ncbi:TRAP transporter small permease subunit [Rhizobium sp. RU36D]|uniref:TRAP transporter small permease n=1 Tax=Rhizobium sp. RU36D TaxID=1907415 RepID=UPI0009D7C9A7|nr:TRAP transporter small permease subunit [Rhizobium sp. RU36D]SMD20869.1 Tripartite ATP-independent transporter, DctQ component [Rhizobium sp. RU36D]